VLVGLQELYLVYSLNNMLAELILWITGHVLHHGGKKVGVRAHLDSLSARRWGVRTPRPL